MLAELKQSVYQANMDLKTNGLVILTWGNVSAIDRSSGLVAIKPSGVAYSELSPDNMVIVDLDGNVIEGKYKPSSDTKTHLYIYKHSDAGAVVHTHSTHATACAQAGFSIPSFGTTHADYFYGTVPCTRPMTDDETNGDYEYETGKLIMEYFDNSIPAVLVCNHGPFTFGRDCPKAVENAVVLEEVARMALLTVSLNHDRQPIPQSLLDRHYLRKHGKTAYYGQ